MNDITKEIFEKYQVRKNKKQKSDFIDFTLQKATEMGYDAKVEKGGFGARNIAVGDPDTAKVVCTAHYDTCARLLFPNFLTPKNFFVYILYNIAVIAGFIAVSVITGLLIGVGLGLAVSPDFGSNVGAKAAIAVYWLLLILMMAGPANKHTANDNTSGVTTLFELMARLPEDKRGEVAFVFFDLEEMGLIGSGAFAKAHKNVRDNTLLLNFDCVSDGKDLLLVAKGKAKEHCELLESAFVGDARMTAAVTASGFYPSDQSKFKHGIGIAAFKKTKGGTLYMNRIHTSKDTVYREENIDFIADGTLRLIEKY